MTNVKTILHLPTENFSRPSHQKGLQGIRLVQDVKKALASNKNYWAVAITAAIDNNKPTFQILRTIQECAKDNQPMVENMIGESLLNEIIEF